MTQHQLSFCDIHILAENLAEVIVHEGIEMNMARVAEYHAFLLANLKAPFGMLINKVNAYSYTPGAQMALADLEEIRAMAVLAYSDASESITQGLASLPRERAWNLRIFHNRQTALDWLEQELSGPQH